MRRWLVLSSMNDVFCWPSSSGLLIRGFDHSRYPLPGTPSFSVEGRFGALWQQEAVDLVLYQSIRGLQGLQWECHSVRCNEDVGFIVEHLHNTVTPIAKVFFLVSLKLHVSVYLYCCSYCKVLEQKEELEQKHLHLLQILDSERQAKWHYVQQTEELAAEVKKLKEEVFTPPPPLSFSLFSLTFLFGSIKYFLPFYLLPSLSLFLSLS